VFEIALCTIILALLAVLHLPTKPKHRTGDIRSVDIVRAIAAEERKTRHAEP